MAHTGCSAWNGSSDPCSSPVPATWREADGSCLQTVGEPLCGGRVQFAHGHGYGGGSLRGCILGRTVWAAQLPSFGVQLHCLTAVRILGGWAERRPSGPVEAGSPAGPGFTTHCRGGHQLLCQAAWALSWLLPGAEPSLAGGSGDLSGRGFQGLPPRSLCTSAASDLAALALWTGAWDPDLI